MGLILEMKLHMEFLESGNRLIEYYFIGLIVKILAAIVLRVGKEQVKNKDGSGVNSKHKTEV